MSLGIRPPSPDLCRSARELCEPRLSATSIYRLLAEQGHRLFADESFADLFQDVGRRSVAPRIVATVMVLQRIEGASDREAVDRFAFDLRWRYAAGVDLDYPTFVCPIRPQCTTSRRAAPCGYTPSTRCSIVPASGNAIRSGGRAIAPRGQRSSARSPI